MADVDSDNRVFAVEQRGIEFVPESARTMEPRQLGVFWFGSSLYPFNVLLGMLIYSLGMPLWLALLVTVGGGALSYAPVALGSIAGARSGMPTHIALRATFGVRGEPVNALLGWAVGIIYEIINVWVGIFAAIALFDEMGWTDSGNAGKWLALVLVYGLCILLPLLGHATMILVQKFFSIALAVAVVLLFIDIAGDIDLAARAGDALDLKTTIEMVSIGMGIAWAGGYSYMIVALDYPRYLPSKTPGRSIFWQVLWGAALAAGFLGMVGAMLAAQSTDGLFDPVAGVKPLVTNWIFVVWALAAIGGSISNNALTLYSAGLAAQAVGLPLTRFQATLVDGVIAITGLIYVLFIDSGTFFANLNSYIILAIAWIGPFGAVWLLDMVWRRFYVRPNEAHGGHSSPFWGFSGSRLSAWIALVAGLIAALLTIASPKFTGPIAKALNNTDTSWAVGPIVALILYWVLARTAVRREVEELDAAAAAAPTGATSPVPVGD
jgi:NCS1 family nucleobase:cation symporter-1